MTVFTIIEVLDLFSYVKDVQQIIILFVMIYKLLCRFLTFGLFDIKIDLQIYILPKEIKMTDKELRRLKRDELLEILFYLQKENDNLKKQNQELQNRIEALTINKHSISDEDFDRIAQIVKDAVNSENTDEKKRSS